MEYEETVENPYGGEQTITVTRPVLFDIHQPACPVFAGTDGIGNPDSIFTSNSLHLALYSGARYEPYPDDITYVWVSLTALVDDAFCHSTLYSWTSYGIGYQPAVRFIRNYAMVFETYDGYVNYEYGLYSILDISDPCNPLYVYSGGAGETMPDIGFTQTEYRSQPGGMCAVNYHTVYAGAGRGGFQETDRNCIDFPVTGYQEFFPVYEPGNDLYWYLFSPQQILYAVSVASEGISPRAAWQLVENDGEAPAFVPFSVSGVQRPQAAKGTSSR